MCEMHEQSERPQSAGEEIANGISHGIGVIAALVSAPFLMISAVHKGRRIGHRRLRRFCRSDGPDVPGIHVVPFLSGWQGKSRLSGTRPRSDFRPHCRHIHSIYARRASRSLGMDVTGSGMGPCNIRRDGEGHGGHPASLPIHRIIPGYGVADPHSDSAAMASNAIIRNLVAPGGRYGIHSRRCILCGEARALRSFRMALLRYCRHYMSLLCGAMVCLKEEMGE